MDNTEIVEATTVEEKKPSIKRYVLLMQHKNERRAAEILNQLPKSKLELKAIYLDCLDRAGLEYDGTRMVDIFYVDKKAVDSIYEWTNFQCSISQVYADCISAWLNDPRENPYSKPGETFKATFGNNYLKKSDFTEYTA
jgi:hypothetical protein